MIKITIEYDGEKVELTVKDVECTKDLVEMCLQACYATGHAPTNIAQYFVEVGEEHCQALGLDDND